MEETILTGHGKQLLHIPAGPWKEHLSQGSELAGEHLNFMTSDHQRVRYYAVEELPRAGKPLAPAAIAQALDLPLDQVAAILDDLEKHLTFLVRDESGAVSWAFPVTVQQTPHQLTFRSGERLYAA